MIKHSLISVITVVLNDEKNILRTLKSVKNQKSVNIEHVVVDGKSKDKTLQILKKNIIKKNAIISEKDKNLYDAINKGIKRAKVNIFIFSIQAIYFMITLFYVRN